MNLQHLIRPYLVSIFLILCSSNIFSKTEFSNTNCNENLNGFSYLGEFDNSKYFVSDVAAQWQTAQANAEANNGYLASINSQAENDFILSNINEIVFIGYNDAASEGNFQWASGEAVSYTNFNGTNSANNDFGKINFWNGGWDVDNQFVSRRYIVEVPCSGGGGNGITLNCQSTIDIQLAGNVATTVLDYTTLLNASTDCTSSSDVDVVGTNGSLENGAVVGEGSYNISVNVVDLCGNTVPCSFTLNVSVQTTGGGCPSSISGFTTLGEFGTSKYYISNTSARPSDAQATASANGGYLVVITSQAENDFVQQGADGLTYIGLNDQNTEGNLEWLNGEPLTYNNVNPCGFCNENSTDQDFGVIQPWNGGWSFSNFFNQRKYIMEIPCNGGGTDLPDLTVSNLSNLTNSGNAGDVISFNFDLNNIGNITATGSYNINTYISTDNLFSADDVLVGEVPTGDTPIGTIADVPAAITVPNLSDGNYFLIVVVDALNQISESNENNNTVFTNFEITSDSPVNGCAYYRNYPISTSGVFRDFKYEQGSNGPTLITNTRIGNAPNTEWIFETLDLDEEGNPLGSTSVTLPTFQKSKFGDYGYKTVENSITQYQVSALQSGGTSLWNTTIDLQTNDPNIIQLQTINQLEVSDHLIVYGVYIFGGGLRRPFVIKLDLNGNEIWQSLLPSFDSSPIYFLLKDEAVGGGYYFETNLNFNETLIKVDADGNQSWIKNITNSAASVFALYGGQAPDGSGVFYGLRTSTFSTIPNDIIKIDPLTGNNLWAADLGIFSPNFDKGEFEDGMVPTGDGGVVTNARLFPDFGGTSENFYGKLDANGNLVWSHLTPTGFNQPPVFETEDGGYIFGKYIVNDNAMDVYKVNSDGALDPLCDDTGCPTAIPNTTYLGEFSGSSYFLSNDVARPLDAQAIANQNGGYLAVVNSNLENSFIKSQINELVYIGLNDFDNEGSPEWVNGDPITYTNFDICSFCQENSEDMDFVVIHSWNSGWSWSNIFNQRKYIIEVPCTNSNQLTDPNLGNTLITLPTAAVEPNFELVNTYPNPAMDEVFATINSNVEQEADIQIFDARGTLVKSENVLLYEGKNTTRISIANLAAGFYSIYIPQMNGKVGMKRFVKVRE